MPVITQAMKGVGQELLQLVASSRQSGSVRASLLTTRDREHALNVLKEAMSSCEHPLFHFTVAGRRRFDPNTLAWSTIGDCSEPTSLLSNARELKGGGVVIFEDYLHYVADENGDPRVRPARRSPASNGVGPSVDYEGVEAAAGVALDRHQQSLTQGVRVECFGSGF